MSDNPNHPAGKNVNRTAVGDGSSDVKSDGHPATQTSKFLEDTGFALRAAAKVGAMGAGGEIAALVGEAAAKNFHKEAGAKSVHKEAAPNMQEMEREKEKLHSLPHVEVTHSLDGKTQHAVGDAATQLKHSQGKDHSLADAVVKNAFLTAHQNPSDQRYNEVLKALSDNVGKLTNGKDAVTTKMEHGRLTASMVPSANNYYRAEAASQPGAGGSHERPEPILATQH